MAGDDKDHIAFVRGLPCCAPGAPQRCHGDVSPHHATHLRGMGQRALDRETMPLCWTHHREFHDGTGVFRGWNRDQRRQWQDDRIAETQALRERQGEGYDSMAF